MIHIKQLNFSYGSHEVFNNFNLSIDSSIFGLIGVNGAGKSTLVNLIIGMLHPDTGTIDIDGINVHSNQLQILQDIGILHEKAVFPIWTKVLKHLTWVGKVRGLDHDVARKQALLILDKLNLVDRKDDFIRNLSAGLKQRFSIAQAIIGLPDIIILDEPTTNLDAKSRIEVLELLRDLALSNDIMIIILSHILNDLETYCEDFAIIHQGKKLYQSTMRDVMDTYSTSNFTIKGSHDALDEVKQNLTNIEIIKNRPREIEVLIHDDHEISRIQQDFNVTVIPTKSKLEELFLELISEEKS